MVIEAAPTLPAAPAPAVNRFSIKDLENLTGIKAHTLRIWEQRYGILSPKRTPTNIRFYDSEDLKLALRISLLNAFGYRISLISRMTERDMLALIIKVGDQGLQKQHIVNTLLEAALAMDAVAMERLLSEYVREHGMEETIELLVFDFLEKIGIMWLTSRLVIAQEHLASSIITRKLDVAIDSLPLPEAGNGKPSFLLFLPEGELHEIALQYAQYLLRKAGHPMVYLGPNTPLRDARLAWEAGGQDCVYVHLTSLTREASTQRYIAQLSEAFPRATVYIGGAALRRTQPPALHNVRYLHSLSEAKTAIL